MKLSNTLAMANRKGALPGDEMYMSGRPLYPVTMNLFYKLVQDCGGELNVSYSAGADALNVTSILAAGARPVTVASDLLKPGGYARLRPVAGERWKPRWQARGAADLDELAAGPAGEPEMGGRRGAGEPALQEGLPSALTCPR